MQNILKMKSLYEANIVLGRSPYCPRKGCYKIISASESSCLNKPALVALAHWKLNAHDEYNPAFKVLVQLESLRFQSTFEQRKFLNSSLTGQGKEFHVFDAAYNTKSKVFELNWDFISVKKVSLTDLSSMLKTESGRDLLNYGADLLDNYELDILDVDYNGYDF
ncbi:hypothetical protein [Pedobacter flavus]|uniref:Uncharacterized protein n=1 Tax=Pedobacter flavus TaxID=3113906 RepID=A0ABU7GZ71_9SPHI|nr:hypothetical protein [Pedobacter sp. VNH31]MEE1884362.1 hypothetical protein [Pedobacter sp. VNH31]